MITNPIHVRFGEYKKLMQKINEDINSRNIDPGKLHSLYLELERAQKTRSKGLSAHIVGMHSTVVIYIFETGERFKFTLVYPEEENESEAKMSIYAPLATAVLGFTEGDEFYWKFDDGEKKILIEKVIPAKD